MLNRVVAFLLLLMFLSAELSQDDTRLAIRRAVRWLAVGIIIGAAVSFLC